MRKLTLALALICLACNSLQAQSLDAILEKLDQAIANRPLYLSLKEEKLKSLREEAFQKKGIERYDAFSNLFREYKTYCADSAIHYAELCEEWAKENQDPVRLQQAQIKRMVGYGIIAQFNEVENIIQVLEGKIYPENKEAYFSARSDVRFWQGSFSLLTTVKENLLNESFSYRDSVTKITKDSTLMAESESMLINNTDPKRAAILARKFLEQLPEGHDSIRHFAHHLGNYYLRAEVRDSSEYYFALSAISDMELGVREHMSLINLTTQLYEDGKIDRAYTYMNQCLKDAEDCKAALRTLEITKMMPQILDDYHKELHKKQLFLMSISMILLVLILVISISWFRIYRISKKLSVARKEAQRANVELKRSNESLENALLMEQKISLELQDSNLIKETYIAQYMRYCSKNLEKLEEYRKQLQQLAMRSTTEKLFNAIKSTEMIEKQLDEFYKDFDETFLNLFPNFVQEFNKLLTSEGQFEQNGKKHLNTELRIFALIRLGITDSNDIANFLRYSVKTIYNYRTKIRNYALGDRNKLEEELQKIGL